MLVTPPCGASSNIALWRAKIKPPVELVVGDLGKTLFATFMKSGNVKAGNRTDDIDRKRSRCMNDWINHRCGGIFVFIFMTA